MTSSQVTNTDAKEESKTDTAASATENASDRVILTSDHEQLRQMYQA